MSNLYNSYTRILSSLHQIEAKDNYLVHRRMPKMTDKQLIALSLAAEMLGINSERYLFKLLPSQLEGLIERSVYNRRLRRLAPKLEQIRSAIAQKIVADDDYHLIS